MPFTLSHAAAVLPVRRRVIVSAFVLGSFAPDFEYFLRLSPQSRYSHELPGLLVFTLPAALFAIFLFHVVIKRPLLTLVPVWLERRLTPQCVEFRFGGLKRFAAIVASAAAGVATHIAWDSFTHRDTWLYEHSSILQYRFFIPVYGEIWIYKILQQVSTLAGIAVLAWVIAKWLRTAEVGPGVVGVPQFSNSQRFAALVAMTTVAVGAAMARAYWVFGMPESPRRAVRFITLAIVSSLAFLFTEVLVYSLVWQWRNRERPVLVEHPPSI